MAARQGVRSRRGASGLRPSPLAAEGTAKSTERRGGGGGGPRRSRTPPAPGSTGRAALAAAAVVYVALVACAAAAVAAIAIALAASPPPSIGSDAEPVLSEGVHHRELLGSLLAPVLRRIRGLVALRGLLSGEGRVVRPSPPSGQPPHLEGPGGAAAPAPGGATARPPLNLSLLWMAPFLSGGGYSSEAISYATALRAAGALRGRLQIRQHGDAESRAFWGGLPRGVQLALTELSAKDVDVARSVVVCHSEPGAWQPPLFQTPPCPPGGYAEPLYTVGRTMFETDRVTPHHVARCNRMDEVWVPTDFHVETFSKSGVAAAKLVKVPQAVDVAFFDPAAAGAFSWPPGRQPLGAGRPAPPAGGRPFVFLSIFKWEARKGWDVLLRAYLREFSAADDVALYILTSPYHSDADFEAKVRGFVEKERLREPPSGWAPVHVLDVHIPQGDMPGLYHAADCFVLPSRGEGWGRPHVEAMAMALPVIATFWSGTTEYMTVENSYPLAVEGLVAVEGGPFHGHLWAEPSVEGLQGLMREVRADPAAARRKGTRARADIVARFSPEVIAEVVLAQLRRIESRLAPRQE